MKVFLALRIRKFVLRFVFTKSWDKVDFLIKSDFLDLAKFDFINLANFAIVDPFSILLPIFLLLIELLISFSVSWFFFWSLV